MNALDTTSPPLSVGGDLANDLAITALELARRIAVGATLWCVAPAAPAHAAHLAVEFLHPVIMGKRAVPAVALEGPATRTALRAAARPGDVLVLLGSVREPELHALARRAAPWGLTTLWFVTDADTDIDADADAVAVPVAADHVLRAREGTDPWVDLVLAYHLLWELTHVVFEHPGLLQPSAAAASEVCVTCADEGRVAEVQQLADDEASVRCGGVTESVATGLVDDLVAGELVLVHAGVAIARIDEAS
ncbi:MAG TPA: HypC/HybG/HupF family hydrogenase formation chaperone [Acidimicrobiia bacterium]|jgi:hydrogenase maturation factor